MTLNNWSQNQRTLPKIHHLQLTCFWSETRPMSCPALCYLVLVFFSPLRIAITSLVEERANFSAVQFALVWIGLFPLPFAVWEGLRLVIVELPRLSSYLFLINGVSDSFLPEQTRYHCPVVVMLKFLRSSLKTVQRRIWNYNLADYDHTEQSYRSKIL